MSIKPFDPAREL